MADAAPTPTPSTAASRADADGLGDAASENDDRAAAAEGGLTTSAAAAAASVLQIADVHGRTPLHLSLLSPVARHSPAYVRALLLGRSSSSPPNATILRPDSAGRTPLGIFVTKHGGDGGGLGMILAERRRDARRRRETAELERTRAERERGWTMLFEEDASDTANNSSDNSTLRASNYYAAAASAGEDGVEVQPLDGAAGEAAAAYAASPAQRDKRSPVGLSFVDARVGSCEYLSAVWEIAELLLNAAHYGDTAHGGAGTAGSGSDSRPPTGINAGAAENSSSDVSKGRRCSLHAASALYVSGHLTPDCAPTEAGRDLWRLALDVHVLRVGARDERGDLPLHAALKALRSSASAANDFDRRHGRPRRSGREREWRRWETTVRAIRVVRTLLEVHPRSCREADGSGALPLSVALVGLGFGSGHGDIRCESRREVGEEEDTAACSSCSSLLEHERYILDLLVQANPGALDDVEGLGESIYPHLLSRYGRTSLRGGARRRGRATRARRRRDSSNDDDWYRHRRRGDIEESSSSSSDEDDHRGGRWRDGRSDVGSSGGEELLGLGAVYRVLREKPALLSRATP